MKILMFVFLALLVGCSNSNNTSNSTRPLIESNEVLRPFASTCGGVSRIDENVWFIGLGNGTNLYRETSQITSGCTLISNGSYSFDVNTNTLTLVQDSAYFEPVACGGIAPNNYTRTGSISRISNDQLKWSYTDYNAASCETIIRE
jgi:hypothetical protein